MVYNKQISQTTRNKALLVNKDETFYGSFAEIGAGQEVARHFFQAGLASQTIAKSISAYDKIFSDTIYGKGTRFVSQERLDQMLVYEYGLLEERLPERKASTCFFSFANTVATSSHQEFPTCHGWMGIRYQNTPGGPVNEISLHVRMLDRLRLQQQEALGILGVNLIYAARFLSNADACANDKHATDIVASLIDNLSTDRIEVNYIRFTGKDLSHIDNRLMSLELVHQNLSPAVMFNPKGEVQLVSDALYKKPSIIQRGTFRPVTKTNMEILDRGLAHFSKDINAKKDEIVSVMEMTMNNFAKEGSVDRKDFLERVDTLCAVNQHVLVTNLPLFSQLKVYLRQQTDAPIAIVIGASTLNGLFDNKYYENVSGGIMGAFSQLFDSNTKLYVYPFKSQDSCATAQTFYPDRKLAHLFMYLMENKMIVDMENCDDLDTTVHSEQVRELLAKGDKAWEKLVPESVRKIIEQKKMFMN
jgi:hypothetical protein